MSILDLFAQKLDHRLGIITVQLEESVTPKEIIAAVKCFEREKTDIQIEKQVSSPFRIWNFQFNHNRINENDFLAHIRQHPLVESAQFDFWIEARAEPNDPLFFLQYYFNNIGQNGGTPGVDLEVMQAWDITTGGVTFFGDTIVLCVIDEGFEINHQDLQGNSWINHDEIPNDDIDNDENGYVDDYQGWNVTEANDDVVFEDQIHGTQVVGIAGASGNNNTGISGLNWKVKLMYVTRGYSDSDAIAAYTYPFEARKNYNETDGNEGAFVVASNTSWGVDYGNPNDATLWCAIYDSLGSVGILSAAATANLDVDVDQVGDLPTTCPSDYIVAVTKVNNNDNIPPNTAYGLVSVDLAAFGQNVFTTNIDHGYSPLSGTSAAAPQVAGTIALLYSAPCPSFIEVAKNQPDAASLLVKEYILNGVEEIDLLQNITVTGGRLNTFNSLQLLMDDCNYSGCYPPYSISINEITDETATVNWLVGITTTAVHIRYRIIGEPNWIVVNNISNSFQLSNLETCTNYEFQLASDCGPLSSDYSLSYEFQTEGCCVPPSSFYAININENQILLGWEEVPAAISYQIRYREIDSSQWSIANTTNLEMMIPSLSSCTAYEFQIESLCSGTQMSNYSESLVLTTMGCSNCVELLYCQMSAIDMSFSWISEVSLSNLDHISENSSGGYGDHTDQSVDLAQGQSYEIDLKSDGNFGPLPGIFNVWIDFDQNGIFDDISELILHSVIPEISSNSIIFVPIDAVLGSTRMRISFLEQNTGPCANSNYVGEVEDYCINIEEQTECLPPINIDYYSLENSIDINWFGNLLNQSYLIKYKEVVDTIWDYVICPSSQFTINNLNTCTDYEFLIQSICEGEPSDPTEIFKFTTKGCGACLDNYYCGSDKANAEFEWIERIQLATLDNISGSNDGFAYFHDHTTNLVKEKFYPIVITPGFAGGVFDGYYKVWVDLNQDGVFDSNEVVYSSFSNYGIIVIPDSAELGSTRMRVILKYQSPPDSPCDYGFFGEIEEYCINIVPNEDPVCDKPESVIVEADFITKSSAIINWNEVSNAVSYNLRYQKTDTLNDWNYITTNNNSCGLFQLEECTSYQVQVKTICNSGLSEFSDQFEFETECNVSTSEQNIELLNLSSLYIFPNPSQDRFFVSYQLNKLSKVRFELFDVTGKLFMIKEIPPVSGQQQQEIEFPNGCSDGLYLLKVKTNDKTPSILKILKTN